MIEASAIDTYREQGFIHLRGVLDEPWRELLGTAIERVERESPVRPRVLNMSQMKRDKDGAGPAVPSDSANGNASPNADYLVANNAWQWNEELRRVAFESPMPALAANLMGSSAIRFYFDQVFLKPPGSVLRTEFHQDLGYWTCQGDQICTIWTAIDEVTLENGAMGYVPGSHLWDERFKANFFVDRKAIPGQEGEDLPDILADEERFGVVYCECEPGDVIIHHVKTIHGSTGNSTTDRSRRSVGFRYTGDDVTYHHPPGIPPNSTPVADYLQDGDRLSGELFPEIWSR